MGVPKQLLQFGGETMLRRAVRVALEAGCRPVLVVTGAEATVVRETLRGLDVREVENEQWKSGMSSSVRVGIEAVLAANPDTAAVVLMVCDQPFVTPEIIVGLVRSHRETNCSIIASRYGHSYGVPALFNRRHFAELMKLKGAGGAKKIHPKTFPKGSPVAVCRREDRHRHARRFRAVANNELGGFSACYGDGCVNITRAFTQETAVTVRKHCGHFGRNGERAALLRTEVFLS
jgi:molybdenum cofactor cytidylyltransferase